MKRIHHPSCGILHYHIALLVLPRVASRDTAILLPADLMSGLTTKPKAVIMGSLGGKLLDILGIYG